jgi:threonine dehydrogenase-like Zn-dependent dehydrogenase
MCRPGGTIVLVGMAATVQVDLTPLWQKQVRLQGAYAYGTEPALGGTRTFTAATDLVASKDLGRLLSATYPLDRYADAIDHAAHAGRRGAVKVAFDLRRSR